MPNTIKVLLVEKARDPMDPRIFQHVTLVAFLAWVGLGADGLSSSAYGPEEAFKALGEHAYLAVLIPRAIFYLGQLVFENDRFYYRLLHNETAFAIQRQLQFKGLQAIVLPIRVLEPSSRRALRKAS